MKLALYLLHRDAAQSSPSRGTWIEIDKNGSTNGGYVVVPLTGDVD